MPAAPDIYPIKASGKMEDQLRTSLWLVEFMVSVMQQYFGNPERIALEEGSFLWNPSQAENKIYINNVDNLDYAAMGLRPAALVDLETHTFPEEVKGDLHSFDPRTGMVSYLVRDQSAFSIECWAQKKLESMTLGDEVRLFLTTYRHLIAKKYCFDKLRVKQQMKPVRYPQFKDHWITRVIVEYELQDNWSVVAEQLKVSGFGLNLAIS